MPPSFVCFHAGSTASASQISYVMLIIILMILYATNLISFKVQLHMLEKTQTRKPDGGDQPLL